ncbi:type VI secretion system-associated FHA domain protein TagH [Pseudomonas izuensis]|uniref:Type VI secretion system-associated FHA domain protein TagH n=1 Tax=Pseudomonas izuensis TaxID=2684212 RepID=A0ABM7S6G3_9PSED|nr:type VI secretion system-associated FHA domain protein TagH [Pseudomonas izuensis]BCX71248.1 type VI secretion system-associated FHA domain protein TagH [Pseudomonas izuensis]
MELVFEMLSSKQFVPTDSSRKTFTESGGVIGRSKKCDWVIPDRKRHVSGLHAKINYCEGAFYMTDISNNGIHDLVGGSRLIKGEALRIENGGIYGLGDFEIRAQLSHGSSSFDAEACRTHKTGNIIPDDVLLELDPLKAVDQQEPAFYGLDELSDFDGVFQAPLQRADYARIDMENLTVPQLLEPTVEPALVRSEIAEPRHEDFWERFGATLGLDLKGFDPAACEAVALDAARLLKQCAGGLQQSLRTRSELKNELRLAHTTVQGLHTNPLKIAVGPAEALSMLLTNKPGQLSAEQAISSAFRDLQAHQVALLAGSRAAVRGALEHCSPRQLTLRFERDNKSLFSTAGSRWKAYGRFHQTLLQDDDWSDRLLTRDFARAYEEQIRLISTLHTDLQG